MIVDPGAWQQSTCFLVATQTPPRFFVAPAVAAKQAPMNRTVWWEWLSTQRGMSTSDLLDPFIDPVVEKHMTLPIIARRHHTSPPLEIHLGIDSEQMRQGHEPPHVQDSKRRRSPLRPQSGESTVASPRNHVTSPLNKRSKKHSRGSAPAVTLSTTNTNGNENRDIKRRTWFASYPKVADVENALMGCGVSQVMRPWGDPNCSSGIPTLTFVPTTVPDEETIDHGSNHTGIVDGVYSATMSDVERAMGACHVSSSTQQTMHPRPPRVSSTPPRADNLEDSSGEMDERPPQTKPLLRLSTSTIVDHQNLIWNLIQRERQEHVAAPLEAPLRPAVEVGTLSRLQHERASGERVARSRSSRSSRAKATPKGSIPSTLDSSRHSIPTMEAGSGHSHTRPMDETNDHAPLYRYTRGATPRDSFFVAAPRTPRDTSVDRSSASGHASVSSMATPVSVATPASAATSMDTDDDDIVTAPCLECAAPLHFSTRSVATKLVVYCATCGTMASTELMCSFIGTNKIVTSVENQG